MSTQKLQISSCLIRLHLQISNCEKDANNLYNFQIEEEYKRTRHFLLNENRFFSSDKQDGSIFFTKALLTSKLNTKLSSLLMNFDSKNGKENYIYSHPNQINAKEGLWIVIGKDSNQKDIKLTKNDFLRFGKQIVKIVEFNSDSFFNKINAQKFDFYQRNKSSSTWSFLQCRICMEEESPEMRFDSNLCTCSKSMPVHTKCIFDWLETKCFTEKSPGIRFFDYNYFCCDVCASKFDQNLIVLTNFFNQTSSSFILFDVFDLEEEKITGKYLIDFSKKDEAVVNIGRKKKGNDIAFNDPTISRKHAKLMFENGNLHVIDLGSTFGTSVLVNQRFPLQMIHEREFLIHKFLLTFHLLRNKKKCKNCDFTKIIKNPLTNQQVITSIQLENKLIKSIGENGFFLQINDPKKILENVENKLNQSANKMTKIKIYLENLKGSKNSLLQMNLFDANPKSQISIQNNLINEAPILKLNRANKPFSKLFLNKNKISLQEKLNDCMQRKKMSLISNGLTDSEKQFPSLNKKSFNQLEILDTNPQFPTSKCLNANSSKNNFFMSKKFCKSNGNIQVHFPNPQKKFEMPDLIVSSQNLNQSNFLKSPFLTKKNKICDPIKISEKLFDSDLFSEKVESNFKFN